MSSKKNSHLGPHKYKLINIGSISKPTKVYGCALPNCTHYLFPKNNAVGQTSICWSCNGEFVLDKYHVIKKCTVHPKCLACRGKIEVTKKVEDKLDKIMEGILGIKL